ncbi:MAG TPA: ABC transporter permease [Bacteroidia bacterium]|nr:ABC transporter permease [Bacteroidia bacterium]
MSEEVKNADNRPEEKKDPVNFSFRRHTWKQFKKNKPALVSFYILIFLLAVAVFAPVIANERPLYMKYEGQTFYPAFSFKSNYIFTNPATGHQENIQLDEADWKRMNAESVVWAPIAWSPSVKDPDNQNYVGPGDPQKFIDAKGDTLFMPSRFRHLLGTTSEGKDLLAGLIHGTRVSLSIGFISMGIASLLGLFLGAVAGYFGDERLQTKRGTFWMTLLGLPFAWFYAFSVRSYALRDAMADSGYMFLFQLLVSIFIFAAICRLFSFLGKLISRGTFLGKKVFFPVDSFVSRGIEILNSIPTLILIISLAALVKEKSMIYVMVIIGLTSWTGIARFTRAEFLRIRTMDYIQAAQAMGFKERRIIFRHALVNGMAPSLVSIAFGIAAAILIESSLSFLNVGVPDDLQTWGKLLFEGKERFHAWWMIIYPGLCIFLTVTVYNLIGEGLRDALDPKLKK